MISEVYLETNEVELASSKRRCRASLTHIFCLKDQLKLIVGKLCVNLFQELLDGRRRRVYEERKLSLFRVRVLI